jgi:NADH-quinone oxidoreductase subunit L
MAWLLLLAPLFSAAAITFWFRPFRRFSQGLSVAAVAVAFAVSLGLFFNAIPIPAPLTWIELGGLRIEIGFLIDPLSKLMLLIVTGVGLLIHIFSLGYMKEDAGVSRFFAQLSLFIFSMIGIVIANNLVMMFIFWELVGLSSYFLVGFWFERPSAAEAAKKAMLTNRVGDFGFLIGIILFWSLTGTVAFSADVHAVLATAGTPITALALLLFCGCVAKSAQLPLHVWLPDAMEGPTPVSALIHAATMVAAGVYMLCRVYPLLIISPFGMFVIASIGCFTAIFAALIAIQQNDIKRILAYSTLSQLGYMVMAVGCGGPDAAMFHLSTHAFFKALLFLAAGSVIHALHDEQDIWKMGGLRKKIPLTSYCFGIGMLALIGFPPFAGFFSKDYILSVAYAAGPIFYWVGAFTAFLTAFYMTRLVIIAFFGAARSPAAEHPHESPLDMTIPLILLSILSFIGGWSFIGIKAHYTHWFDSVRAATGLVPAVVSVPESNWFIEQGAPLALVIAGVASAYYLYWGRNSDPLHIKFLARKFYIDEIYQRSLVGGQQLAASKFNWFDNWILDGLIIRGIAYVSVGVGELLRLLQTGSLQTYAFIFSIGGVLLVYFTLLAH